MHSKTIASELKKDDAIQLRYVPREDLYKFEYQIYINTTRRTNIDAKRVRKYILNGPFKIPLLTDV